MWGQDIFEITAIDDTNNQPVLKFAKPIRITFRYLDEEVKGFKEDSIKMRYYNRISANWEEVASTLDTQANSVMGSTSHLTLFAFTGQKTEKSGIIGNNLNWSINFSGAVKNIILILAILIISGIGGWYVYKTYLQAKREMELENKMSIAGGSDRSTKETLKENEKKETIESKEDKEGKDSDNQIWIDF